MADTQFGMYTGNEGFSKETENFERAIEAANKLQPAFVIVCGDLVNSLGTRYPYQMAEYKRIASKLSPNIPLYNVAGNHDVHNRPTQESLENYREYFGPDYYTFKSHNLYGIVLNSSLIYNPSGSPKEANKQFVWLRKTLKETEKMNNTNVVIFQHHPWFISQPDEEDQYYNIPRERRGKYLDLFHEYGVKEVFAGHMHKNAIGRDGDLTMTITGPVGKPLGDDPSGFRVVIVKDQKISSQYYGLDSVPSEINFQK